MNTITLTTTSLSQLISIAVELGENLHQQMTDPEARTMSKPKVLKYLKMHGLKPAVLNRWEMEGKIFGLKHGERRATTYDSKEVRELVMVEVMR